MKTQDLERLSAWLRCNPVAGREDERKSLTEMVERELRSASTREGLNLDGIVQIPEWMGQEKPTAKSVSIEELEAILNCTENPNVTINLDGSINVE